MKSSARPRHVRRFALAGLAVLVAGTLSACVEEPGGSAADDPGDATVAFLMPDLASTRYEQYDAPLFEARMKELCGGCEVIYQNADSDAALQQQQADSAIAKGASVIVLDPVDSTAAAQIVQSAQSQDVKVVAYDRPIPDKPADFYVSFDNKAIGKAIAESLMTYLDESGAKGGVLQVNGSPTDAAAGLIKEGITEGIDESGREKLAEYDTPDWQPEKAQQWVSGQITKFGDQIVGVVAANDGTGGGAVAAFKNADVAVPPITGNDAELSAVQRIINGDQYNTISKPIKFVAEAAADVAWDLVQGEEPEPNDELFDTPTQLFEPTVVTRDNLKEVIFGPDGVLEVEDVCTGEYRAPCQELGLL